MEKGPNEEGLTFNGFPIKKRGKVNAENLASSILSPESIAGLMHNFENDGVGLEQIADLQSTLGDRRQGGKISDDRKRALDRLEELKFSIIGSPDDIREEGDTFRGESGKGRLLGSGKYAPGIERRLKKRK